MSESFTGAVVAGVSAFATGLALYSYFNSKRLLSQSEEIEEDSQDITLTEDGESDPQTPSKMDQETDTSELSRLPPVLVPASPQQDLEHHLDPTDLEVEEACISSWSAEVWIRCSFLQFCLCPCACLFHVDCFLHLSFTRSSIDTPCRFVVFEG